MTFFFNFPGGTTTGGGGGGDATDPVIDPNQEFFLSVDPPIGGVVGTVVASDNVAVTGFSITAGDTLGAFAISNAGVITVANDAVLDMGQYTLTVQASDAAGNTASETVLVFYATPSLPLPLDPTFNSGSAVTINPGDNASSIVAANPAGTHYQLVAGTYTNFEDVRLKAGDHMKGAGVGVTILEGTGKGYCIRPESTSANNVAVGCMTIQNYGDTGSGPTTRADWGAVMVDTTDVLANQFGTNNASDWTTYDLELAFNASNGLFIGNRHQAMRVTSYGHTTTGVGGDRGVGGILFFCNIEANGFNPTNGAGANGANCKITWWNAGVGRSSQGQTATKEPLRFISCSYKATRSGVTGSTRSGQWFDLDCRDCAVEVSTFEGHDVLSVFFEGCNFGYVRNCSVDNASVDGSTGTDVGGGFGSALGENFVNGALSCGESTNIEFDSNTLNNCGVALVNRLSNREGDWFAPDPGNTSFVNYAWNADATGDRYWISNVGPTPIPGATINDWSTMWTGNNLFRRNDLNNCTRVMINEGTNGTNQTTQGQTDLASIQFVDNDYADSPGIIFYEASTTALTLTQWQALPRQRDN